MDLDPTITLRTSGRAAQAIELTFERDLAPADLALLDVARPPAPSGLKSIRAAHHAVAQALASGKRPGEVAALTGYSASRISVLQGDPAFQELLAFYRENANLAYANLHDRLARVSHTAVELLEERMLENPDAMTEDTLLDIVKMGADRTGHGPQSKNLHLHADAGDLAGRLQRGRERAAAARQSSSPEGVIEGTVLRLPSPEER